MARESANDSGERAEAQESVAMSPAAGSAYAEEDDPSFAELKIDAELIAQIDEIVGRRDRLWQLIRNTEEKRAQVKTDIYTRVLADYHKQVAAVDEEYEPVSHLICQALAVVAEHERSLREDLEHVNDAIVEMRFRCEVGEFSEEDLFPMEAENLRQLKELSARLQVIDATYARCREYLREEDFCQVTGIGGSTGAATEDERIPADEPAAGVADEDLDVETADVGGVVDRYHAEGDFEAAVFTGEAPRFKSEAQRVDSDAVETQYEPRPAMRRPADESVAQRERAGVKRPHCFIVVKNEQGGDEAYLLGDEPFAIGRHPKNNLVLNDRGISRRHARILPENGGRYSIQDLSSGNGVFVNGVRLQEKVELNNGDHIVMGACQMSYVEKTE
ncbi:MAG: FHA domain-containing protein [Deltaproteobacteria bacterium]|nr:FHA domain-containing protein [Deltaproteobacteria bacterium]